MAFLLWSKDERKKVKDENPDLKSPEIAVKLGAAWHKLTEEQRRPYVAKAAEVRAAKRAQAAKDVDTAMKEERKHGGHKKHKRDRSRSRSPSPPRRKDEKKKKKKEKKEKKRRPRSDSEDSDTESDSE